MLTIIYHILMIRDVPRNKFPWDNAPQDNCSKQQLTKIKGTEEHGLLQMISRRPTCSSIAFQMVICQKDGSPDDQNQGDRGADDHMAFSIPS